MNLRNGEIGNFAAFYGFKGEDNLLGGYTEGYKLVGDADFGTILLNPDFGLDNVEVN